MEDNLVEAMVMAFSAIVFIIALTLTMYMFSKVTYTSEVLTANADTTRFYENVEMKNLKVDGDLKSDVLEGKVKIIDSSSIIPTLYRYYKENFCVKIYDATDNTSIYKLSTDSGGSGGDIDPRLIQIFDMTLEGRVNEAVSYKGEVDETDIQLAPTSEERIKKIRHNILINAYHQAPNFFKMGYGSSLTAEGYQSKWFDYNESNRVYMFGAPWIGSTENTKKRIDYFISGSDGYINNQYVNYIDNPFALALRINGLNGDGNPKFAFTEKVISYSYTGSTEETDEGDVLVNGAASKDKLVVIYTIIDKKDNNLIVRSENR